MLPKIISLTFLGLGVFVLMQVLMPIIAFKTWEVFSYDSAQVLADPNPGASSLLTGQVLGISVQNISNFPAFISNGTSFKAPYKEFQITIPSINLNNIKVLVESNDFEQNLAHLPGTALPGERGNVFITGHSSIDPRGTTKNSKALFVDLPKIKKGEVIYVEALGQKFTYEVMGMKIVDPKEISVIYPPDKNGRYISLMTCVPPGFYTKRLVVLAKLK